MRTALHNLVNQPYKHGFVTDIETEAVPRGLSEAVIRLIRAGVAAPIPARGIPPLADHGRSGLGECESSPH